MKLRDLLDAPELWLRPLYGDESAWERPVRWVFTTDLPDPSRYVTGGELVVTGLVWRTTEYDSERFVAAVAAGGAAGLAAGDALFGTVPRDVVEACERHRLPLMSVPEDVSFAKVTEFVVGVVTAARGARLAATVGRQRQLLAALAEGRGLDELTARVSRETGLVCRVLTPTGRCVVPGPAPPRRGHRPRDVQLPQRGTPPCRDQGTGTAVQRLRRRTGARPAHHLEVPARRRCLERLADRAGRGGRGAGGDRGARPHDAP